MDTTHVQLSKTLVSVLEGDEGKYLKCSRSSQCCYYSVTSGQPVVPLEVAATLAVLLGASVGYKVQCGCELVKRTQQHVLEHYKTCPCMAEALKNVPKGRPKETAQTLLASLCPPAVCKDGIRLSAVRQFREAGLQQLGLPPCGFAGALRWMQTRCVSGKCPQILRRSPISIIRCMLGILYATTDRTPSSSSSSSVATTGPTVHHLHIAPRRLGAKCPRPVKMDDELGPTPPDALDAFRWRGESPAAPSSPPAKRMGGSGVEQTPEREEAIRMESGEEAEDECDETQTRKRRRTDTSKSIKTLASVALSRPAPWSPPLGRGGSHTSGAASAPVLWPGID